MKVIVLGAKGMLGTDLMNACRKAGIETEGFDLPEVDIARDDAGLKQAGQCDWVVNCAAYTDVDGAEKYREKAFSVNGDGAGRVARWCRNTGTPLVHISTDYVFDGNAGTPYREDAETNPLNVYGMSKLAGEKAVISSGSKYLIVRTQSLFSRNGRNFVQAIMSRLEEEGTEAQRDRGTEAQRDRGPLKVVNDQTSSPTYTVHLADAILRLLKTSRQGIVHVSASGECTWYEFACAIAASVRPGAEILPVTSGEYPRPARRPAYSVLDKALYKSWTGCEMPGWREGLEEYVKRMSNNQ